jgi:hypothetical protein
MAKPIKATPDLVGEEANRFLRKMICIENSKITKKDRELAQKVMEISKKLTIYS